MSYNGAGLYVLPTPAYPAVPGEVIEAEDRNEIDEDIAGALSIAWPRDGQAAAIADMSMGDHKLTNLKAGTSSQDAVNVLQVFTDPTFTGTTVAGVKVIGTAFTVSTLLIDMAAAGAVTLPALTTGVTAAPGDVSTKLATTAFVDQKAFSTALPGQAGNAGKVVTTDGTSASWTALKTVQGQSLLGAGDVDVFPARAGNVGKHLGVLSDLSMAWVASRGDGGQLLTASTVFTVSSAGASRISPTTFGQVITLPDATTCPEGVALFSIENLGTFDVLIRNTSGTLLGFISPGVTVGISLADNTTAAGVWTIANNKLFGVTVYTTSPMSGAITYALSLDTSRELLIANNAAVVYDASTGTFGTPVSTITSPGAAVDCLQAVLTAANQVLLTWGAGAATQYARVLSISGTTITANTVASRAQSNTITSLTQLILTDTNTCISSQQESALTYIAGLSISGTTVTIGASQNTNGNGQPGRVYLIGTNKVMCISSSVATNLFFVVGTISGSTITTGAAVSTAANTANQTSFFILPSGRFAAIWNNNNVSGSILSISGSTITASHIALLTGTGQFAARQVGNQVIVAGTSGNANVLTDVAGAATAGVAITLVTAPTNGPVDFSLSSTELLVTYSSGAPINNVSRSVGVSGNNAVIVSTQTSYNLSRPAAVFAFVDAVSPQSLLGTIYYTEDSSSAVPWANQAGGLRQLSGTPTLPSSMGTQYTKVASQKAQWRYSSFSQVYQRVEVV